MKKIIFFFSLLLFVSHCSNKGDDVAGTSTEVVTGKPAFAAVEGLVVFSDNTPCFKAKVDLRDQANIHKIVLRKTNGSLAVVNSGRDSTDINGFFRFDSVDTGKYWVAINYKDSLGALAETEVLPTDTLVNVDVMLKPLSNIVGKIDSVYTKAGIQPYIYLPALGLQVAVDEYGNFVLPNLPSGNYVIRIIQNNVLISAPSDSLVITVLPGATVVISKLGSKEGTVVINGIIVEEP